MTPERWHRITDIFHVARERDAAERDLFLADLCRGDVSLRQEVDPPPATAADVSRER
jgi:hypothetical protein